ncbi:MAG: hypothetical protein IJT95_04050, partial [Abditibacteriota bacterium]|nr:hypothetical protein [Abditibacteriota bacterium]
MKRILLIAALAALLALPGFCQELSGKYLDVRITLEEDSISMPDLCERLSKASGASIVPDEDWRVKERQMTVFCHNALLPHVMYSIVDVTRFYWQVKDENTYILCYRTDTDKIIAEILRKGQQSKVSAGQNMVDGMMRRSGEDMDALRKENPAKYLMKSTGAGDVIGRALKASPALMKAMTSGERRTFSASEVAPETLQEMQNLNSLILDIANDVCDARNTRVPKGITDFLSRDITQGNVEIEVNGDIGLGGNQRVTRDQINTVCSGYAVVRTDGRISCVLPIINTDSGIANNLAELAVDLLENPRKSFDEVFSGLDVNALLQAVGKDVTGANDVYKTPVPYDPAMSGVIDLGSDPGNLTEALRALEKATGAPVFCDNFGNNNITG